MVSWGDDLLGAEAGKEDQSVDLPRLWDGEIGVGGGGPGVASATGVEGGDGVAEVEDKVMLDAASSSQDSGGAVDIGGLEGFLEDIERVLREESITSKFSLT